MFSCRNKINVMCYLLLSGTMVFLLFNRFGKHYELPLLAQSVIMTFVMLALVQLCVNVKHKTEIIKSKENKFSGNYTYSSR